MLIGTISERIEQHYEWPMFEYWLGDDSELSELYRQAFVAVLNEPLTNEQIALIERKGINLEKTIHSWLNIWRQNNPGLETGKLPLFCLKHKIHEYIVYQLKQTDIREIIGVAC
jgi:hypothetical protein